MVRAAARPGSSCCPGARWRDGWFRSSVPLCGVAGAGDQVAVDLPGVSLCGVNLLRWVSSRRRGSAARSRSARTPRGSSAISVSKSSTEVELPVDAGEAQVGDLVQFAQRSEDRHADLVGRDLRLTAGPEAVLDQLTEPSELVLGHRSALAGLPDAATTLSRLNGSTTPLRFTTTSCICSVVVKRRSQIGHCRRRRMRAAVVGRPGSPAPWSRCAGSRDSASRLLSTRPDLGTICWDKLWVLLWIRLWRPVGNRPLPVDEDTRCNY